MKRSGESPSGVAAGSPFVWSAANRCCPNAADRRGPQSASEQSETRAHAGRTFQRGPRTSAAVHSAPGKAGVVSVSARVSTCSEP